MKATGEVMAIGRTYEESLLKAIRSLEYGVHHLGLPNGETYDLDYIKVRSTNGHNFTSSFHLST